jgi:tetratricopeptide (TPR) repeat protein
MCFIPKGSIECQKNIQLEVRKNLTGEEIFAASERNIDRALNIQSTTATFLGILAGLITLIITIGGLFGIFEYRRWKTVRKELETEAKYFKNIRRKAKVELEEIRKKSQGSDNIISDKPSKESLERMTQINKKLEQLELFGVSFKPNDYIDRGNDLFYKRDFENAIVAYNRAIELQANNYIPWFNKSLAYIQLNKFEKALESVTQSIQINPSNSDALNTKGLAYMNLKRKEEALATFDDALKINPNNLHSLCNKAHIYNDLGKYYEALDFANKVLKIQDSNESALLEKGVALSN